MQPGQLQNGFVSDPRRHTEIALCAAAPGKRTRNRAPPYGPSSTPIVPPCARTMLSQTARASIRDGDLVGSIGLRSPNHLDGRAFGRNPHGIPQKVEKDLACTSRVFRTLTLAGLALVGAGVCR